MAVDLHKTIKYRRFRELFIKLCRKENIGLYDYNLYNIRVYDCYGKDLKGDNVKYNIIDNCSCFVNNNYYEVYEIPKKTNKKGLIGEFLVFVRNVSFDYYILLHLNYRINYNRSKAQDKLCDIVKYHCYGKYSILADNQTIIKDLPGSKVDYGGNLPLKHNYDSRDMRKLSYKTTSAKLYNQLFHINMDNYHKIKTDGKPNYRRMNRKSNNQNNIIRNK